MMQSERTDGERDEMKTREIETANVRVDVPAIVADTFDLIMERLIGLGLLENDADAVANVAEEVIYSIREEWGLCEEGNHYAPNVRGIIADDLNSLPACDACREAFDAAGGEEGWSARNEPWRLRP